MEFRLKSGWDYYWGSGFFIGMAFMILGMAYALDEKLSLNVVVFTILLFCVGIIGFISGCRVEKPSELKSSLLWGILWTLIGIILVIYILWTF